MINMFQIIKTFFVRRLWLSHQRLFFTAGIALVMPVILHVFINSSMKFIVVRSIRNYPYEEWVFPGILLIIMSTIIMTVLYRDIFEMRIQKKVLPPVTLAPVSKNTIMIGIVTPALMEALIFVIIGASVLVMITGLVFSAVNYFIMLFFNLLFGILVANLFITISLLSARVSFFIFNTLGAFSLITFGSGILFEFDFYPQTIGKILINLPFGMAVKTMRLIMFSGIIDYFAIIFLIFLSIVWFVLNGYFLKTVLKQ